MELGSCVLLICNLLKLEDIDNIKHKLNDSLTTDTVFGSTFKETPLYQKCFVLSMDESGPLGFEKLKKNVYDDNNDGQQRQILII